MATGIEIFFDSIKRHIWEKRRQILRSGNALVAGGIEDASNLALSVIPRSSDESYYVAL